MIVHLTKQERQFSMLLSLDPFSSLELYFPTSIMIRFICSIFGHLLIYPLLLTFYVAFYNAFSAKLSWHNMCMSFDFYAITLYELYSNIYRSLCTKATIKRIALRNNVTFQSNGSHRRRRWDFSNKTRFRVGNIAHAENVRFFTFVSSVIRACALVCGCARACVCVCWSVGVCMCPRARV
jgi:hypothetical protein